MYNQGVDQEKIPRRTSAPYYSSYAPQPNTEIRPVYPPPQQSGYPPVSQPGGYPPHPTDYPPQPTNYPPLQHQPVSSSSIHNTNTTVVIQQQPAAVVVQQARGWSTGLCACFDDCGVCMLGCFCPCILQCTLSSNAGECCCVAAACPIALRTKIRTRHNIAPVYIHSLNEQSHISDILTVITSCRHPKTMTSNSTNRLPIQTNGHKPAMIPRYMNPMLETSQSCPNMAMTSPSRATKQANQNIRHKAAPTAPVIIEPTNVVQQTQSTMHQFQNVPNDWQLEGNSVRNWSSGLFSCFDEWSSCLLGSLFPCCLAMTISCSLNECCCTACCYPVATRTKLRTEYNIVGTICEDAYVLCWCYQCAICQMAREIDFSNSE